jgi:EVE domain-containing protein
MRYWVNTISRAHVQNGVAGGFTQADHGKDSRLKRLSKGDAIVFYSPRADMRAGETVQRFTAIGEIDDDAPYQVEMSPEFHPWRRRVKFLPSAEAPIQPLIENLEFIPNKKSWGFPFRRGLFEIKETDFKTIARAMSAEGANGS